MLAPRIESMPFLDMKEVEYFIVDVFAERKFAGNQLAVFIDNGRLSTEEMQAIACEMNFSETTFVTSIEPRNGGYDTRIFTPVSEMPFAGHPTLGTALTLQQKIVGKPVDRLSLNLQVGQIPVEFVPQAEEPPILWMTQNEPEFGRVFDPPYIARLLSIEESAIDQRAPTQMVSTGLPTVIVCVKDPETLRKVSINQDVYRSFIDGLGDVNIFVYCHQGYTQQQNFSARVFADWARVPEDPATGSANGCFASYLLKHRILDTGEVDVVVGQGYEIGRPSQLYLKSRYVDGRIEPKVGGRAFIVASGKMEV